MEKEQTISEETVLVCHAIGTTSNAPEGASWIDYWMSKTKCCIPNICPCCKKFPTEKNPMVGAHVVKVSEFPSVDRKFYITPTCKYCNDTHKGAKSHKAFTVSLTYLCKIEN